MFRTRLEPFGADQDTSFAGIGLSELRHRVDGRSDAVGRPLMEDGRLNYCGDSVRAVWHQGHGRESVQDTQRSGFSLAAHLPRERVAAYASTVSERTSEMSGMRDLGWENRGRAYPMIYPTASCGTQIAQAGGPTKLGSHGGDGGHPVGLGSGVAEESVGGSSARSFPSARHRKGFGWRRVFCGHY